MTDATLPAAGWYADPKGGSASYRWWDGAAWTGHTREATQAVPPSATPAQPAIPATPKDEQTAYQQPGYQQPIYQQPVYPQPTYPQPTYSPPSPFASAPPAPFPPAPPVAPMRRPFGGGQYNPEWDYARGKNSASNTALLAGIASVVTFWIHTLGYLTILPITFTVGALVWGIVGLRRSSWLRVGKKRSIWAIVLGSLSAVGLILGLIGVLLGAAATPPYSRALVQQSIVDGIKKQSGQTVTVDCPPDPSFTVGSTFQCVVTDNAGANHIVDVKVQDDTGYITWQTRG